MARETTVIRQSGAILLHQIKSGTELLLKKKKKNPAHWIFPKGHIEPGETAEAAAARELLEEAGVEGCVTRPLGTCLFARNGKSYSVTYFLLQYVSTPSAGEAGREPTWYPVETAMELLSFPEIAAELNAAVSFFKR